MIYIIHRKDNKRRSENSHTAVGRIAEEVENRGAIETFRFICGRDGDVEWSAPEKSAPAKQLSRVRVGE